MNVVIHNVSTIEINIEFQLPDLAVVNCSNYGSPTSETKTYAIKYNAKNIIGEIKGDDQDITINTDGDYIIEVEGDIYFEPLSDCSSDTLRFQLAFIINMELTRAWGDSLLINKNDGYGHFYAICSKSISNGQVIKHTLSGPTEIDSYTCEYKIKI